jgi:hypothetical protein
VTNHRNDSIEEILTVLTHQKAFSGQHGTSADDRDLDFGRTNVKGQTRSRAERNSDVDHSLLRR